MKPLLIPISIVILFHAVMMLYGLYRRRRYKWHVCMYYNRLLNLYCADSGLTESDFMRLDDKMRNKLNFWIDTHNIDYYMNEYAWSYSTIANPLVPSQGVVYVKGLPAERLVLGILKELSDIDFRKYIDKATATDFQYQQLKST